MTQESSWRSIEQPKVPSSSGSGRWPLTPVTGVRIPTGSFWHSRTDELRDSSRVKSHEYVATKVGPKAPLGRGPGRYLGVQFKSAAVPEQCPHRLAALGHRPFKSVTGVGLPLGTPEVEFC